MTRPMTRQRLDHRLRQITGRIAVVVRNQVKTAVKQAFDAFDDKIIIDIEHVDLEGGVLGLRLTLRRLRAK